MAPHRKFPRRINSLQFRDLTASCRPAPTQTTLVCIKLVSAVGDDVQRWWLHRGRLTGASRILEEAWWFENSAGHQEWITGQSGQHEVRALDAYFSWNDGRESWFVDFVRNQDEDPIMYQWDMIPDLWSIGERVGDTAFQKQILEDLVTLVHYRCKFLQWTFLQPIVGAVMGWANGDGALAAKSPLFTLCVELFAQKTWADQLQEACDGTPVEMHGPLLKAMLKNRYYYPLSYTTTVSVADHL